LGLAVVAGLGSWVVGEREQPPPAEVAASPS
jgi:hypothetical protein